MKLEATPQGTRASPPSSDGAGGWHDVALGVLLTLVWAATILVRVWQVPGATVVQVSAFALFVALAVPMLPRVPLVMLALCAAVALATMLMHSDFAELIVKATGDAAYLAAFFAAMSVLREAAATSRAVHVCGEMLVSRPPGKRYVALSIGGSLLSIIINSGALNLLGGMVKATNTLERAGGDPRIRAVREQRMILALLRSFCAGILLSPLSLGFAVTYSAFPQVGWMSLLSCALVFGILLMAIGALADRLAHPRPQAVATDRLADWAAALPLAAIVSSILALVVATEIALGTNLIVAVMVCVPVYGFVWMFAQGPSLGIDVPTRLARTARRACDFVARDLASARVEVVVVSTAGFAGALLSGLLPLPELRALVTAYAVSPALILVLVFLAVLVLGQMGANPILSVTVLGALFPDPQSVGLHPLVLAMTLFVAWVMTTGSSSAIAAVLILARICGVPPSTIGRDWNGAFTLIVSALFLALLLAAHAVVGSGAAP